MAGLPPPPPVDATTRRELRLQAGVPAAVPTAAAVYAAPRIKPSAPSQRDYGKNPGIPNPADLGEA
jgi:hypothetical protein